MKPDDEAETVTLSGLLNFTDGLWSCCGEEKIMVFTTNHRGGVDEALLRAGRMDVHLQLGGCGGDAMREMLGRYVGGEAEEGEEELAGMAERCVGNGVAMTAAEVGEVLLRNKGERAAAVKELLGELEGRISGGGLEEEWEEEREKRRRGRNGCVVKEGGGGWERRVQFFSRLRGLSKSESGRRGV